MILLLNAMIVSLSTFILVMSGNCDSEGLLGDRASIEFFSKITDY